MTTARISGPQGKTLEIIRLYEEFWNEPGPIEFTQYHQQLVDHITQGQTAGRLLYHYTTLPGLLGIVNQRAIWASDVRMMNDRSEISFGLNTIRRAVEERLPGIEIGHVAEQVFRPGRTWQFASCFSQSRDQLSQWRAYGAKIGISIGFDRDHLAAAAQSINGELCNAKYLNATELADFSDEELEPIVTPMRESAISNDQHRINRLTSDASRAAVRLASKIKHPTFEEEREFRCLFARHTLQDIEFRSSTEQLIPYVRFPLDGQKLTPPVRSKFANQLGMVEILVWPNDVDDQILDALDMLLGPFGVSIITRSASPYRS